MPMNFDDREWVEVRAREIAREVVQSIIDPIKLSIYWATIENNVRQAKKDAED